MLRDSILATLLLVGCAAPPPPVAPPPRATVSAPDPEIDRMLRSGDVPPAVPEPRAVARVGVDEPAARAYRGAPIDLDVKNAEVVEVLRLLADVGHVNLVIGDDVKGTITLKLRHVPWDQALDVLVRAKGLGLERDGNVMTVGSLVYPPAH